MEFEPKQEPIIDQDRILVLPGDLISTNAKLCGDGTFSREGKIYSALYGIQSRDSRGNPRVISLFGKYIPKPGDFVIGKVVGIYPGYWEIDIGSPYLGNLPISEIKQRLMISKMRSYLDLGQLVYSKVKSVDACMRIKLSLRSPGLRCLRSGVLIKILPTRLPRLIGKRGSMLNLIKERTGCQILVGQNGWIWLDGAQEKLNKIMECIRLIEQQAHTSGLTDRISQMLS